VPPGSFPLKGQAQQRPVRQLLERPFIFPEEFHECLQHARRVTLDAGVGGPRLSGSLRAYGLHRNNRRTHFAHHIIQALQRGPYRLKPRGEFIACPVRDARLLSCTVREHQRRRSLAVRLFTAVRGAHRQHISDDALLEQRIYLLQAQAARIDFLVANQVDRLDDRRAIAADRDALAAPRPVQIIQDEHCIAPGAPLAQKYLRPILHFALLYTIHFRSQSTNNRAGIR